MDQGGFRADILYGWTPICRKDEVPELATQTSHLSRELEAITGTCEKRLKKGFLRGVSIRHVLLLVGLPVPVGSSQCEAGRFPRLLGKGLLSRGWVPESIWWFN